MERQTAGTGLSPERIARIRSAQKRHTAVDPGCEELPPEEVTRWHPVNGMTWEERAAAMREAGLADAAEPVRERVAVAAEA